METAEVPMTETTKEIYSSRFASWPMYQQIAVALLMPNPEKDRQFHTMDDIRRISQGGNTWTLEALRSRRVTTKKDPEQHLRVIQYVTALADNGPIFRTAFIDAISTVEDWASADAVADKALEFAAQNARELSTARLKTGTVRPKQHGNKYTAAQRRAADAEISAVVAKEPEISQYEPEPEPEEPMPAHAEPAAEAPKRLTFVESAKALDRAVREASSAAEAVETVGDNLGRLMGTCPPSFVPMVAGFQRDLRKFNAEFRKVLETHVGTMQ